MASHQAHYKPSERGHRQPESAHTSDGVRLTSDASMPFADSRFTGGRHASSRQRDDRYHSRQHDRHSASGLSADAAAVSRSPVRRRRSWPPQPFAEDETVSLKREFGSRRSQRESRNEEVPYRGSIDQEPIMVDLLSSQAENFKQQQDISNPSTENKRTAFPTPPTSDDERLRRSKARSRPARLATETTAGLPGRDPSPHSWNKPSRVSSDIISNGRFLSPDTIGTPFDMPRKSETFPMSKSQPSSPNRNGGRGNRSSRDKDYFSPEYAVDESTLDDMDDYVKPKIHERRVSPNSQDSFQRPAGREPEFLTTRAGTTRHAELSARRNTGSQDPVSSLSSSNVERSRRPPRLTTSHSVYDPLESAAARTASLMPTAAEQRPRSRESSYSRSRPVSPATSSTGKPSDTPPRSPRLSTEVPASVHSGESSRPSSILGSLPSSPMVTTRAVGSPRTPSWDRDGSSPQSAAPPRRTNMPPSRLAAEVSREASPELVRRDTAPVSFNSLPYPVDDETSILSNMPYGYEHQWRADEGLMSWPAQPGVGDTYSRSSQDAEPSANLRPQSSYGRPTIQRAYSAAADISPTETRSPSYHVRFAEPTFELPTTARKYEELAKSVANKRPKCAQRWKFAGEDDWLTVKGGSSVHFCPDCAEPMRQTVFDTLLRRFEWPARGNGTGRVYCAFELPWMVRAWMFTLHEERQDFQKLKALAEIDRCPGTKKTMKVARGVRHPESGGLVQDFHICEDDYRKIRELLPRVSRMFVERSVLEHAHDCRVRADSADFRSLWDALEVINARAKGSDGFPDPTPLIEAHNAQVWKRRQARLNT